MHLWEQLKLDETTSGHTAWLRILPISAVEDQDILPCVQAHNIVEDQDNKSVSEISPRKIDDVSNER